MHSAAGTRCSNNPRAYRPMSTRLQTRIGKWFRGWVLIPNCLCVGYFLSIRVYVCFIINRARLWNLRLLKFNIIRCNKTISIVWPRRFFFHSKSFGGFCFRFFPYDSVRSRRGLCNIIVQSIYLLSAHFRCRSHWRRKWIRERLLQQLHKLGVPRVESSGKFSDVTLYKRNVTQIKHRSKVGRPSCY